MEGKRQGVRSPSLSKDGTDLETKVVVGDKFVKDVNVERQNF